jgi:hypothetical protein
MHHHGYLRYASVETLKAGKFKRFTGVSREMYEMYEKMQVVLQKEIRDFGKPQSLPTLPD